MASAIDATKPTAGNALTFDVRENFAAARSEIEALQTYTGDETTRIDTALDARAMRAGDLAGTIASTLVTGLQGRPFTNAAPNTGQMARWSGSAWEPGNVSQLTGRTVSNAAPVSGQVLAWSGTQWQPTTGAAGPAPSIVSRPMTADLHQWISPGTTEGVFFWAPGGGGVAPTTNLPRDFGLSGGFYFIGLAASDYQAVTIFAYPIEGPARCIVKKCVASNWRAWEDIGPPFLRGSWQLTSSASMAGPHNALTGLRQDSVFKWVLRNTSGAAVTTNTGALSSATLAVSATGATSMDSEDTITHTFPNNTRREYFPLNPPETVWAGSNSFMGYTRDTSTAGYWISGGSATLTQSRSGLTSVVFNSSSRWPLRLTFQSAFQINSGISEWPASGLWLDLWIKGEIA